MYVKYINQNHDTNIVWNGFANRVNSNNLPLTLVPIGHNLNTHWSSVNIKLLLSKRLCQWISHILQGWNSTNLYIFFINISNEMEASKYVFGSLVRFRFLSLHDRSIVVTIEVNQVHNAKNDAKFTNELSDPNSFLSCTWGSYILNLYSRIDNYLLLWTLPTHNIAIQEKHKPNYDQKSSLLV